MFNIKLSDSPAPFLATDSTPANLYPPNSKTIGPLVVLLILWAWPVIHIIQRKPYAKAAKDVAKMSLFWLKITYISVSTTVCESYVCVEVGEEWYLRAQIDLPCDSSERRQLYVVYSAFMVLLYHIGVPLLLFVLMYPNRNIIRAYQKAVTAQETQQTLEGESKRRSHSRRETFVEESFVTSAIQGKSQSLSSELRSKIGWLSSKFEDFTPTGWWAAIFFLMVRFSQTSLMVLCTRQAVQINISMMFTIAAIVVLREAWCFRRGSE